MKPNRRTILRSLAAAPMAAGFVWTDAEAQQAHHQAQAAQAETKKTAAPFRPKFFTRHEYATVTLLVDLIIPKDERSGSATEAGVPQFMDFMMTDQASRQTAMRGGLAWINQESRKRFGRSFVAASDAQRRQILDDIAWPAKAPATLSGTTRARFGGAAARAASCSTVPAATIWPRPLWLAAVSSRRVRVSATSSGSPPTTALIEVGVTALAAAIARPRSRTNTIACSALSTPTPAAAVISPTEWPAATPT